MTFDIRHSGQWVQPYAFAKFNGAWHDVKRGYVKQNGVWELFYTNQLVLEITNDISGFDMETELANKYGFMDSVTNGEVTINIASTANVTDGMTIDVSQFDIISVRLNIGNGVSVTGAGGAGGSVLEDSLGTVTAYPGEPGSTGLYIRNVPVSIDNQGLIGGGGGGGGGWYIDYRYVEPGHDYHQHVALGGGGGGGFGVGGGCDPEIANEPDPTWYKNPVLTSGDQSFGIYGGAGAEYAQAYAGDGGDLGQPGQTSYNPSGGNPWASSVGKNGGVAGYAVDGVSNVTWINKGDVRGDEVN